jgi:hypothetical protein
VSAAALAPDYRIQREAEAAKAIRESLAKLGETDADLVLDMTEGETSLFECIDALLLRMASDKALVVGTESVISDLEARKRRVEKRIEFDRGLIEQAMAIAELSKIERPAATLSLANRAPSLRIDSEADIPAEFWTAGAPKLERKAITDALKEGRAIPGVALSNAAPSLSVRIK